MLSLLFLKPEQQTLILLILLNFLLKVSTLGLYPKYPFPIPIGSKDTMGMSIDLTNIIDSEAEINISKDKAKKGKFVPIFQNLDLAIGLRVDILNEDRYEDPFVVDGILTGALTYGMKIRHNECHTCKGPLV